ncbi:MAG: hypothetical protein [Olavius algarvensis spirochete endosymbiont]|nr:MAG: hypothetical protein [Olavius algarvensis spirochete endosymbiont]
MSSYFTFSPLLEKKSLPSGIFSVALAVAKKLAPGNYPASSPAEPGLSSRLF